MNSGDKQTPVEYFLWTKGSTQEGDSDRLIYYDEKGNYYDKPIPREQIEQTLTLFDGLPRTVRRSSGGWIDAIPRKLVILETVEGPKLQVRVEFADLKRGIHREVLDGGFLVHQKIVDPTDLHAAMPVNLNNARRFVMDFGRGIVPIWVYGLRDDEQGNEWAYFLSWDNYELAVNSPRESKISLEPYRIPKCCLRHEGLKPEESFEKIANANLRALRECGASAPPDCLKLDTTLSAPGALTEDLLRHILSVWPKPRANEFLSPLYTNLNLGREEELIPFGLFEGV